MGRLYPKGGAGKTAILKAVMPEPMPQNAGSQPAIRLEDALAYSFKEQNRARLMWLPGAVLCIVRLLFFIPELIIAVALKDSPDTQKFARTILQVANIAVSLLLSIPLGGYLWQLMGQWRSGRPDDPPPPWTDASRWGGYIADGLKLFLYNIFSGLILAVPILPFALVAGLFMGAGYNILEHLRALGYAAMVLSVLVSAFLLLAFWFLISPFIYAPIVRSSPTRRLNDLFALPSAWRAAKKHYSSILQAMLWTVVASLLLLAGSVLLAIVTCCIGVPLLQVPYQVAALHLLNQALPIGEETPPATV